MFSRDEDQGSMQDEGDRTHQPEGAWDQPFPPHLTVPTGPVPLLLVCEHASNRVPDGVDDLGLDKAALADHISWDPGALPVAEELARLTGAGLVAASVSRLVVDVNRLPDAPDLMPSESGGFVIPGNQRIDRFEYSGRMKAVFHPFHSTVEGAMTALRKTHIAPVLVTIHSFTRIYMGAERSVEVGVLHDTANKAPAEALRARLAAQGWDARLNEPYSGEDGVLYTLNRHAGAYGLPALMIEIRSDLIAEQDGQHRIARQIADGLSDVFTFAGGRD